MEVEVERLHAFQPSLCRDVARDRQRHHRPRPRNDGGAEREPVLDGDAQPFEKRQSVPSEALLAGHESIAMVGVLRATDVRIVRPLDVMMWSDDQAGAFTLQEVADSLDL